MFESFDMFGAASYSMAIRKGWTVKFTLLRRLIIYGQRWLAEKATSIDKKSVIKDIYHEVEISGGYFMILTIANLIALIGLIMNSAPVIIGAMLISPLMGPILSTGFAFATGSMVVGKKAIKKISVSLFVTIIIAAIATYISPLKDITPEIIARTRPNLYDLFIAFFSGIVGATAICTKKNYVTIISGVAIATAVIPPLSVTGFGFGIGSFQIASGGFLLFFTNFVAIIIATFAVFYFYGLRPGVEEAASAQSMKKKLLFLGLLLLFISIPLIYTLHSSIKQVRMRKNIQTLLKREFNREGSTRLVTFSSRESKDRKIQILTTVNTTSYLKQAEISAIEKRIQDSLKSDIVLNLEQIKVQPGGLIEEPVKSAIEPAKTAIVPLPVQPGEPAEILRTAREDTLAVFGDLSRKVEAIISPSKVADIAVIFSQSSQTSSIVLTITRDTPLSAELAGWLERIISVELGLPLRLEVRSIPFVPVFIFKKGEITLAEDMKNSLLTIKEVYATEPYLSVAVTTYPETKSGNVVRLARQRSGAIRQFLIESCGVPEDRIGIVVKKPDGTGVAKVAIAVILP
jgi:uncharacterized hydrophobic protein (TIGR00271 family)